jgi:WD40 repeat protein/uncharacterized caspase-like protein
LRYPAPDCQGLGQALAEATRAFPEKEVRIHHDFAAQSPNLDAVRAGLQQIVAAAKSQDTVLFYFSGHGVLEPNSQQAVLCLADTWKNQLLDSGLRLQELLRCLGSCAARQQLVWLDACHSGGMTLRGARGQPEAESLANPTPQLVEVLRKRAAQSQGFYALLSCDQAQQSWEFPELGHGVFTYYLMQGLRGEAADSQGIIEADGLYKYVYHQTLHYIDKTNQQIRLVNQQKRSRGKTQLQSEYPLQTPKRIVEGVGELILGLRSPALPPAHPRRALVVEGLPSNQTTLALSKVLQGTGSFALEYWPQPGREWSEVREAIQACLGREGQSPARETTTALLYLRGRIEETEEGEAWLVLGDGERLSRSWFRQVLRRSWVRQQIIILDCPGASLLGNWVEDLQLGPEWGQCLIAAAAPVEEPEQFAQALLQTLNQADLQVGLPVAGWIAQLQVNLAGGAIAPHVWLSGTQGVIEVLPARVGARGTESSEALDLGFCPYMGLRAFAEENASYFYGREALTQKLIAELAHHPSLAVVGASGSGKSSVVQAGLIAQLRQGKQLPGSGQWWIGYFRPGANPIEALARRLVDPGTEKERAYQQLQIEGLLYQGVEEFVRWLRVRPEPMVVLVVDQFEELFTLAAATDRQHFLELVLGAVAHAGDRFKLVLTLRADLMTSCLEVPELAQILQLRSVLVPPDLTEDDYRQAIIKPAEQVGLKVEPGLAEVLLQELNHSAQDLPLLEFVLEMLWERRQAGKLTLQAYQQLGGLKGALERQAQAVYDSLDSEAQACTQWIFLNLTQLGEGVEDTRRQVTKSDLVVAKYPAALVERTLQALTTAKLVVVNREDENEEESAGKKGDRGTGRSGDKGTRGQGRIQTPKSPIEVTVEVVHETLIRHWSTLRWWLEENRARLRLQRQLERAAMLWEQKGQQADFLLRGVRLAEAEELYVKYTDELSEAVQQFVEACLEERQREQLQAQKRLRQAQAAIALISLLGLAAFSFGGLAYRQKLVVQAEKIEALSASSEALLWSNQQLESLVASVRAGQQLKQSSGFGQWLFGSSDWTETRVKTATTLQQALDRTQELNRLEGHSQQVNQLSFSPDGQLLASASHDNTVKLWRRDGTLLATLTGHSDRVISVAFSPDGKLLASASADNTIKLWRIEGGTEVAPLQTLTGHRDWVTSVSFSPDGKILASASRDQTVKLWRRDGSLIKSLTGHRGWVNHVSFSPDGQTIASASEDNSIKLWRRDGTLLKTLAEHRDRVTSVTFTPDSKSLASVSGDGKVRLWDVAAGTSQLVGEIREQVNSVSFSPDGKTLAVASTDGRVSLWRRDGILVKTLQGHGGEVLDVRFSPDGQVLASTSADKTIRLWNVNDSFQNQDGGIYSVSFSPVDKGKMFATADWEGTVELWHRDGGTLGRSFRTLAGHESMVTEVRFSPNGKTLASASWDRSVKLWQLQDGKLRATLKGHGDGVTSVAFNPNGKLLASGSEDKTIKLWQLQDGKLRATLKGHGDGVTSVAFSPNGKLLASGSYDQTVKLWRRDGTLLQTLDQHDLAIAAVSFSPDGNILASASWDNTIRLWRIVGTEVKLLRTLTGHQGGVTHLDFSPNSKILTSSSVDGTIKLWDVADGVLIKTLIGHHAPIQSVSFSPDGQALISADEQRGVILWNLELDDLLRQSCDRLHNYLNTNATLEKRDRRLCD